MAKPKMAKGSLSNYIAWVFITLQIMLTVGGLVGGLLFPISLPRAPPGYVYVNVSFHNLPAAVGSVVFLFCGNILGIGALILSLIVWLRHNNQKGKTTAIVAAVVIVVNSLQLAIGN